MGEKPDLRAVPVRVSVGARELEHVLMSTRRFSTFLGIIC